MGRHGEGEGISGKDEQRVLPADNQVTDLWDGTVEGSVGRTNSVSSSLTIRLPTHGAGGDPQKQNGVREVQHILWFAHTQTPGRLCLSTGKGAAVCLSPWAAVSTMCGPVSIAWHLGKPAQCIPGCRSSNPVISVMSHILCGDPVRPHLCRRVVAETPGPHDGPVQARALRWCGSEGCVRHIGRVRY